MVAIDVLLLVQSPLVLGVMDEVPPTHAEVGPVYVTAGLPLIVIGAVGLELQPIVLVNVNVTVPALRPVTTPLLVTVATDGLLLVHVPPVLGDKVDVKPTHTMSSPVIETVGLPVTVSGEEDADAQLDKLLTKVNVAKP